MCIKKNTEHHNIDDKKRKSRRFSKKQLVDKNKLKQVRHNNNYRKRIQLEKASEPDQNAITLSSLNLTSPQKSLLLKGPSFVRTPKDISWYELRKDFTKFVNQLCFKFIKFTILKFVKTHFKKI